MTRYLSEEEPTGKITITPEQAKHILKHVRFGEITSLAEMIAMQRTRRKISQSDLAKVVGISRNYVSLIERGNENVSFTIVLKICDVLGLDINIGVAKGGRTKRVADG